MDSFWNIINIVVLGFSIVICLLGIFYKHISFGWGLGDLIGYFFLYGFTILHLILTIYFYQNGIKGTNYLAIIFLAIITFICLKATIWRGYEYRWNGSLFYLPCPKKIIIKNQNIEKELLVRMCTMEYNSNFAAKWNGAEMEYLEGEIKIPNKLNKYLDFPIKKILIRPHTHNRMNSVIIKGLQDLYVDTLQLNTEYELSGEIIEVADKIPIFEVRIKDKTCH